MSIFVGPSLGKSSANPAQSGYHLKQVNPSYASGYYWIKSASMPNALQMYVDMTLDGGGYDFYAIQGNGTSTNYYSASAHSGYALGLDLVYPRSKLHWQAMSNYVRNVLGGGSEYFQTAYAIYRTTAFGAGSRNGNYTGDIMRDPTYYGSGAPDWRVPDGGRWWLRDTTFGEPNGDYAANAFLGLYSAGYSLANPYTGADIGFNDGTAAYYLGAYYLVSTNAKP